jgi:hypothetical protein
MKFSKYWVAAAGLFGISQAQSPSPPFTNVPLNLAPLYFELYEYCIIQGGDTVSSLIPFVFSSSSKSDDSMLAYNSDPTLDPMISCL